MNEASIFSKLKNDAIIEYHNWYETKNHLWLTLEYLPGPSLKSLIKEEKTEKDI